MSEVTKVDLKHIARVEGYGRLEVDIANKKLQSAKFHVLEGARFFEGFTQGKKYTDIPYIISRICAICSFSHHVVASHAVENAVGITISKQTDLFRKLLIDAETIHSHTLHTYFLAVPDYLRKSSAIEMAASHPDLVKRAFFSKGLGNEMQRVLGGRAVHPLRNTVGGITMFPAVEDMKKLRDQLPKLAAETMDSIKIFKGLHDKHIKLTDKKDYVAIHDPNEYAYYRADLLAHGHGQPFPAKDYQKYLKEEVRPYSHTKFATINGQSFMVGALARLNLNYKLLTPKGKEALELSGLQVPSYDTYSINMAQFIETVDVTERAMELLDYFISKGFEQENIADALTQAHPGNGVAVTEAPRGLLVHQYTFDNNLRCTYADIITPTAFNQHKMETDCADLIPKIADKSKQEIELYLNMLIRAYDPCISCSAHAIVDVDFV